MLTFTRQNALTPCVSVLFAIIVTLPFPGTSTTTEFAARTDATLGALAVTNADASWGRHSYRSRISYSDICLRYAREVCKR